MLIFSVVIFVFSHMIYELFPNYVPRPPLPRKVGVMTPSSYGSAAPVNMKKRSERRKLCALAVVRRSQKFSPRRRPPSRGRGHGQNLISWGWSLPSLTGPVWWRSMRAISSYRGNRPTNKQTHKYTQRQDRLQYTAPL